MKLIINDKAVQGYQHFSFFSPSYPSVLVKIEYGFLTNQNLWIIYPKLNWKKMKWNQFNFENGI